MITVFCNLNSCNKFQVKPFCCIDVLPKTINVNLKVAPSKGEDADALTLR